MNFFLHDGQINPMLIKAKRINKRTHQIRSDKETTRRRKIGQSTRGPIDFLSRNWNDTTRKIGVLSAVKLDTPIVTVQRSTQRKHQKQRWYNSQWRLQDPSRQLCYAWDKVRDQSSLILFDPRSTHNFIFVELAQNLGIRIEELGPALEVRGTFKRQQVPVTPLIGKLCIHVQDYVDQEEFYVCEFPHSLLKMSSWEPHGSIR